MGKPALEREPAAADQALRCGRHPLCLSYYDGNQFILMPFDASIGGAVMGESLRTIWK